MERTRVLIFTNHFYPENFKVNEIAFDFAAKGYDVTVVTGIPNYPSGKIYRGYGFFSRAREKVNEVTVIRLPLVPRGNGKSFRLILNYCSYFITSSVYAFFLACTRKFDIVFVHETSPVTIAVPGIIYKKLRRIPMLLWVLDLWPESVRSASNIKSSMLDRLITKLVRFIYACSDKILISSNGFRQSILEKGNFSHKLQYFPNWAEDAIIRPTLTNVPENGQLNDPAPGELCIMYTGNMGDAQDFGNIMQTMLLLKPYPQIKWVLVGGGRKATVIEKFVHEHGLQAQVRMMGNHPVETMPYFFSKASVMLLSLKDEPIFRLTVPAKLQAYMGFGKPVLGVILGEAADIIHEAECGMVCEPGNAKKLAETIKEMASISSPQLEQMGKRAAEYYRKSFEKEQLFESLHRFFQENRMSASR